MNSLRECRKKSGYSQKYVAIEVGVKPPTVSQWESGIKNPTIENCLKLAEIYHVSLDSLLGRCPIETDMQTDSLSEAEQRLISAFRRVNQQGQELLLQLSATIENSDIYKKRNNLPNVEAE